jgi:hypothetical protein
MGENFASPDAFSTSSFTGLFFPNPIGSEISDE